MYRIVVYSAAPLLSPKSRLPLRETQPALTLTLLSKPISALFKYLICKIDVPTSTTNNTQVIGYVNTSKKIREVDINEERALVDRTVYPPKRAHLTSSENKRRIINT